MIIDVYISTNKNFLAVPEGTVIEQLNLPKDIDKEFLTLSPSKKSVDICRTMLRFDEKDVIQQIKNNGYATIPAGKTTTFSTTVPN